MDNVNNKKKFGYIFYHDEYNANNEVAWQASLYCFEDQRECLYESKVDYKTAMGAIRDVLKWINDNNQPYFSFSKIYLGRFEKGSYDRDFVVDGERPQTQI